MFLPDRYIREPALLVPGRKPRGRMVVDWRHPLSKGLTFCKLAGDAMNLVSGQPVVNNGVDLYKSGDFFDTGEADYIQGDNAGAGGDNTLLLVATWDWSIPGDIWLMNMSSSDGNSNLNVTRISTGLIRVRSRVTDSTISSSAINKANISLAASVSHSAGVTRLAERGATLISESRSYIAPRVSNTPTFGFSLDSFEGLVHFMAHWSRALNDAELQEISANPYQFLKPAGSAW